MSVNLKLIAHGVPDGQSIWGSDDFDKRFIETFYGLNTETEIQLRIDIQKLNSTEEVFYTYYRKGNVFSQSNRSGSYIAFTIKSNQFYTDIYNVYNILNATFEKIAKDKIYKISENKIIFSITDFNQISEDLKIIENNIIEYLSNYSINGEFIPIKNFNYNLNAETIKINLLECNNIDIINEIKAKGKASISSSYAIKKHIQEINNKNEELNKTKIQYQQYIDSNERKYSEEIHNLNNNKNKLENNIKDLSTKYEYELNRANKLNIELTNYVKEHKNKIDLKSLFDEVLNLNVKIDNQKANKSPINLILLIIILINTVIVSINIINQNEINDNIEIINDKIEILVEPNTTNTVQPAVTSPVSTPVTPPVEKSTKIETKSQAKLKANKELNENSKKKNNEEKKEVNSKKTEK